MSRQPADVKFKTDLSRAQFWPSVDKPRLYLAGANWCCNNIWRGISGMGRTPSSAYNDWLVQARKAGWRVARG